MRTVFIILDKATRIIHCQNTLYKKQVFLAVVNRLINNILAIYMSLHNQQPASNTATQPRQDFNYKITKFFLDNTRLTILSLLLLIILGVGTLLALKTTGFPSPEIKLAVVNTVYPGASSETIVKEVTQPIESAIKDIAGVENYTSVSSNSFSSVRVNIQQNANLDTVRTKIDAAVKAVNLPDGADSPTLFTPEIGGPDYIFTISNPDLEKVYRTYQKFQKDLTQIPQTAEVTPIIELEKKVVIQLNEKKLQEVGITADQIKSKLQTLNQTIPIIDGVNLDGKNSALVTKIVDKNFQDENLEDIKDLEFTAAGSSTPNSQPGFQNQSTTVKTSLSFQPLQFATGGEIAPAPVITTAPVQAATPPTPVTYKLTDLAEVSIKYEFVKDKESLFGYYDRDNNQSKVVPAVVVSVKTAKNVDQGVYNKLVDEKIQSYSDVEFAKGDDINKGRDFSKVLLTESLSINDSNKEQVDEVIGGLIGSPLKGVNDNIAWIGWALGGIQLVFLVMIAFVSWRAAIVAAISIPMSLVFSTIYLYFIGENLNTLVLFSLVLVIGLVVDPALVIMEAIQRKMDIGLKGKDAVLEAVRDVGAGLFMASLTNIIVFVPFGVISGTLGAIFSYIPLTIIPATIGSYIVPLVFLAWLGGLILKPSKKHTTNEEENLWPIAKWLIKFNEGLLSGSRIIRTIIIVIGLVIPITVAGILVNTEKVKVVQFSSNDNVDEGLISATFLPSTPQAERNNLTRQVLEIVSQNNEVAQIVNFGGDFQYQIRFKPALERTTKSSQIVEDINNELKNKFDSKFFDLKAGLQQTGPSGLSYQVAVGVKTSDLTKLKTASQEVATTLSKVCKASGEVSLDKDSFRDQNTTYRANEVYLADDCKGGERVVIKIDDGYTNKDNRTIEVLLDRRTIDIQQQLLPGVPLTILANQLIKSKFQVGDAKEIVQLEDGTDIIKVYLEKDTPDPMSLEEIKNLEVTRSGTQVIRLSDVATIRETFPKQSITRVKGETVNNVQARLNSANADNQQTAGQITRLITDFYNKDDAKKSTDLGLSKDSIATYSEGSSAEFAKSFQDLLLSLILAIFATYLALALFFKSLLQPLTILYTIPLTFLGVFPGLAFLASGQIGFLEIIGIIILVGVVENVAIFLVDAANQKIRDEGWDPKKAIAFASGVRFRPVILTKLTAIASLAPLAVFSIFYRSIAITIIFGLLASGFVSLITTPILYIFLRWVSAQFHKAAWFNKILFFPFFPIYLIVWAIIDRPVKKAKTLKV